MLIYIKFLAVILLCLSSCSNNKSNFDNLMQNKDIEKPIYLAIEGMPGSGKSTMIYDILKQKDENIIVIPELNPPPGALFKNSKELENFYHQEWYRRKNLFNKLKPSLKKIVLFDRSSFSNLAVIYALDKLNKTSNYNRYYERYTKDLIDFPYDYMVILDVSVEESIKRKLKRDKKVQYPWNSYDFLKYFRYFYKHEIPKILKCPYVVINTDNLNELQSKKIVENALNIKIDNKKINRKIFSKNYSKKEFHLCSGQKTVAVSSILGYTVCYFDKYALIKINNNFRILDSNILGIIFNNNFSKIEDAFLDEQVSR